MNDERLMQLERLRHRLAKSNFHAEAETCRWAIDEITKLENDMGLEATLLASAKTIIANQKAQIAALQAEPVKDTADVAAEADFITSEGLAPDGTIPTPPVPPTPAP